MGPIDYATGRDGGMNFPDDEQEGDEGGRAPLGRLTNAQRNLQRLVGPGWQVWPVLMYDGRTEWSARPSGAPVAVIYGRPSAAELIDAVYDYEADLDDHLQDARQRLAEAPPSGIGRDWAAVLEALIPALEKLQAQLGETG